MKVFNIRLGFANNSSSTHSIILIPSHKVGQITDNPSYSTDAQMGEASIHYGWENFTLASPIEKRRYLQTVFAGMIQAATKDVFLAEHAAASILGNGAKFHGGIDHQSCMTGRLAVAGSECAWSSPPKFDAEFIGKVFESLVDNDRVIILGGNDNSDGHPLRDAGQQISLPFLRDGEHGKRQDWLAGSLVREEPYGFCFMNLETGAKVRVAHDFVSSPETVKPETPELVDLKITNHCVNGCAYCYQNSTPSGEHANVKALYALIESLAGMRVMEVVLGGGEPTTYPSFKELLYKIADMNMVPSFTTYYNLPWIKDPAIVKAVEECCGSFAVSVCNVREALDAISALKSCGLETKAALQCIIGYVEPKDIPILYQLTRAARMKPLSLVGRKASGRALKPWPKPIDIEKYELKRLLTVEGLTGEEYDCYSWDSPRGLRDKLYIAVDTALLQQAPEIAQVNMCDNREGFYSMYIDGLTGEMYESSYNDKSVGRINMGEPTYAVANEHGNAIVEAFAKLGKNYK